MLSRGVCHSCPPHAHAIALVHPQPVPIRPPLAARVSLGARARSGVAARDCRRREREGRDQGERGQATPKVDVKSWELPNGLKVLFLADHKAPIATVQVFYHVGSKDEHVGIRGVAHMFEHMMFKGTEHVPPEEHARLLKEVGGQVNAFTTEDVTAYHDTVPPSYVEFAMQLEAERMRSLKLFPAMIDSERKVVEEEKRLRIDNNPIGKAIERFRALAYTKHPYNWTAIGTIEDLDKVTPEDCQKFYDTYYQPNNATLIVVGDVAGGEVRSLADKYFGPIPRGAEPPRTVRRGAAADGDALREHGDRGAGAGRRRRLPHPARRRSRHARRSRCWRRSCRAASRRACTSAWCARTTWRSRPAALTESMEYPGLFIVFAAHLPDRDQSKVKEALLDEIRRVRTEPVTAHELEQAKNQLAAGYIFGLQTVDGIAQQLGQYQYVYGDWREFLKGASRYLAVDAADVKRVAAQVSGRHQPHAGDVAAGRPPAPRPAPDEGKCAMTRTMVFAMSALALAGCASAPPANKPAGNPSAIDVQYEPAEKSPAPGASPAVAKAPGAAAPTPDFWKNRTDLIKAPPPPAPAELSLPKVDRWQLKNGLEVLVIARHDLPVASFSIAVKAGGYDEEKGKTLGVADFTASMLRKGTKARSADQIAGAIDFVGGQLDTQSSSESSLGGVLGAVEGRAPVHRPAVRHPAAARRSPRPRWARCATR